MRTISGSPRAEYQSLAASSTPLIGPEEGAGVAEFTRRENPPAAWRRQP